MSNDLIQCTSLHQPFSVRAYPENVYELYSMTFQQNFIVMSKRNETRLKEITRNTHIYLYINNFSHFIPLYNSFVTNVLVYP